MKKFVPSALLLAGALAACGPAEKPARVENLPRASVHVLKASAGTEGSRIPATVQPVQQATISTRQPARVQRVHVREGDAVKAGVVLVTLANDDLRAQLAAARATLATADAQLRRLQRLTQEGAATRGELEAAQTQHAQALAQVGVAEEALRYTELRAPFAGRVQAKRVTEGDLVTPGAPLIDLEGSGLELLASLSTEEVGAITRGSQMSFEVDGAHGRAEVTSVAPSADPVAHRVEVRARIVEAPQGLRAGSFARLELPTKRAASSEIWIPTSALVQRGDLRGVFVAAGQVAELRWLQLGDAVGNVVPVRAGLDGNELIVNTPGNLKDGQPIEVAVGD
jgi:RND family efflux transporter MFP subunit